MWPIIPYLCGPGHTGPSYRPLSWTCFSLSIYITIIEDVTCTSSDFYSICIADTSPDPPPDPSHVAVFLSQSTELMKPMKDVTHTLQRVSIKPCLELCCAPGNGLIITRRIFHQLVLGLNAPKINYSGSDFRSFNQLQLLSHDELNWLLPVDCYSDGPGVFRDTPSARNYEKIDVNCFKSLDLRSCLLCNSRWLTCWGFVCLFDFSCRNKLLSWH